MEVENNNLSLLDLPNAPTLGENDELIDMSDNFNIGEYQVARLEYFAHTKEPSITFSDYKFHVNTACIKKFPNTDYVQVLINKVKKVFALRPCEETAKDALPWARITIHGKREPKTTPFKIIFLIIFFSLYFFFCLFFFFYFFLFFY